jgi:DHA2 family multidrug resistance protein
VTTLQARRAQVHQNFLVEHLPAGDPSVMAHLHTMSEPFIHGGYTSADARIHAEALLASTMSNQAAILGFLDVFWILGWISAASAVLAFFIRPFDSRGGPPSGE